MPALARHSSPPAPMPSDTPRPAAPAPARQEEESIRATTARLQELGAQRRPLYEQADVVVPLDGGEEGAPLPAVVWRTLALLRKRLAADADERRRAAATAS